jgi:hypothetical protein
MADLKTLAAAASTAATAPPPKRTPRKKPAATPPAKPKRSPKAAAAAAAEVNVLVASATADGLRSMAGERGLPTGGTKAELAARIAAHDAAAAPAAARKVAGPPPGTRRTTFDLPEQDHRDLRVACLEQGVAAAHVVRVLVRRFLDDPTFRAEIVDDATANGRVA